MTLLTCSFLDGRSQTPGLNVENLLRFGVFWGEYWVERKLKMRRDDLFQLTKNQDGSKSDLDDLQEVTYLYALLSPTFLTV